MGRLRRLIVWLIGAAVVVVLAPWFVLRGFRLAWQLRPVRRRAAQEPHAEVVELLPDGTVRARPANPQEATEAVLRAFGDAGQFELTPRIRATWHANIRRALADAERWGQQVSLEN